MYLNKFRTFLFATTVCSQILISQSSFADGTFKVEAHREFMDLFNKRGQIKKFDQPSDDSLKPSLTSLNKGLKAKIKSLEKALKIGSTEDFKENTNKQKYVEGLRILSTNNDIKQALDYITPTAEEGFIPGMFLAASCNEQLERPREAVTWYATAVSNGDKDAYQELLLRSQKVSPADRMSVHATFQLAQHFMNANEHKEASSCFDRLIKCGQNEYPEPFLEGLNFQVMGRYPAAWIAFKKGAHQDPVLYKHHLDSLLLNPRAFLSFLSGTNLTEDEIHTGEENLRGSCKKDPTLRNDFQDLAMKYPRTAYMHGCYLLDTLPSGTKPRVHQVKSAFRDFVFAASKGHKLSKDRLIKLVQDEKSLKLNESVLEESELMSYYRATFNISAQPVSQPTVQKKKVTRKDLPKQKTWSDWLSEAQDLEKSGDIEKATSAFEKAGESNEPEAKYAEGMFYAKQYMSSKDRPKDLMKKAERSLKKASEKGHVLAAYELGNLYFASKQYDQAKEYWERAHRAKHLESTFRLAIFYTDIDGNKEKEVECFGEYVKYGKGPALFKIAMYLLEKGNSNDASANLAAGCTMYNHRECLEKLIELAQNKCPYATLNLGVYYYYRKDLKSARTHLEHLLTFNNMEQNVKALLAFNIGRLELSERDQKNAEKRTEEAEIHLDLAEKWFLEAVGLGHVEANFGVGRVYFHKKDIPLARKYMEKANELMPGNKDVLYYLGVIDHHEGRNDEGFDKLLTAHNFGNEDVIVYLSEMYQQNRDPEFALSLGLLNLHDGQLPVAASYFEIVLKCDKESIKRNARSSLVETYIQLLDYKNTLLYAAMCVEANHYEFVGHMRSRISLAKNKRVILDQKSAKAAQIAEQVLTKLGIALFAPAVQITMKKVVEQLGSANDGKLQDVVVPTISRVQPDAELGLHFKNLAINNQQDEK